MKLFRDSLMAYPSVVFLQSPWLAVFILLVSFLQPNIAMCGLLALAFAYVLIKLWKIPSYAPYKISFFLNALLIGTFTGDYFLLEWNSALLIFLCVALVGLCTVLLYLRFQDSGLPILSLPFSLVALLLALAAPKLTGLVDNRFYLHHHEFFPSLPLFLREAFISIGTIFCIPDAMFGSLLLLFIGMRSPLTVLFFMLAYTLGHSVESLFSFQTNEFNLMGHGFNYALIFTALASGFLIPSSFSFLWAIGACLLASLISISLIGLLGTYQVPIMALPFNLTVLAILASLRVLSPSRLSYSLAASPEAALERSRILWLRHRTGEFGLFCPFEGEWTLQQGFDGEWTHKGNWKHALDFVISNAEGKTFTQEGIELTDYYAFDKKVLSPINGSIVHVESTQEDNKIGKLDNTQNWGNYIIIRTANSLYVTLAHLKKDSIEVKNGDYVSVGQVLGRCGNSGYSKEPHIHIQVQAREWVTAYTLPFHLMNYKIGKHAYFHNLPQKEDKITPLNLNKSLDRLFSFALDSKMNFQLQTAITRSEKPVSPEDPVTPSEVEGSPTKRIHPFRKTKKDIVFEHKLDDSTGAYYWTDGKSKLYYAKLGSQFYFYGYEGKRTTALADLFLAASRIPLCFGENLEFTDTHPLSMSHSYPKRMLAQLWQLLSSNFVPGQAYYRIDTVHLEVHGSVLWKSHPMTTYLKIDPMQGITEFKVGKRSYVRNAI